MDNPPTRITRSGAIPDCYGVVVQALRFAAQEARMAGMPEIEDQYLNVLVQIISADLELVPKRNQR